jgi:uncharacterized protein YlxW (UPF0749 family)
MLAAEVTVAAISGIFFGVCLGAWLGSSGALRFLRGFFTFPLMILKSPAQIKNVRRKWQEDRERRKIRRIRLREHLKELRAKIAGHKSEIKKANAEMRRAVWQSREPQ